MLDKMEQKLDKIRKALRIDGYQPEETINTSNPPQGGTGVPSKTIRQFGSGATRDSIEGKNQYSGFLSPLVLEFFGDYMRKHQVQSDGNIRSANNWQKGIPKEQYFDSLIRHIVDLWMEQDGYPSREGIEEAIGGIMFNINGYCFELLKEGQKKG